ncbi:DUF3426 domain-containing protein [Nitrosomonas sp. JL21]|uniref:zinc-ribbon and DUF3426 domain-containing protein n=1 Tax=Nitrosomonas sp. JL21 TaxID=153949 RepID=UPI00136AB606|nr:zinc-ribbon and DUF3426 domain-containing protein [Nitrosomonas sp. JL21]MBL8498497.1 zinc-ribbon and DUF3426 domain-containing protein [Nitrosomonas sp.]MCC7092295.1 zinc-ribbon and DUF3426 domain-containing protein [Nitrosomonas sp.]MXS76854.1 DUF3426 domain-containing protein [Nitrosomonas sp. JL21]
MALVTICPDCATAFRVNAMQLQAHGGDVRCGQCLRVFNGFTTLITISESVLEHPAEFRAHVGNESEATETDRRVIDHSSDVSESSATISDSTATEPGGQFLDEASSVGESWGRWAVANVFALLLLLGQIAYTHRTELTILMPVLRPHLEHYCLLLGCEVPYPQSIKQLGIETSDLEKNLSRQPEVTSVSAVIRNYASFPQALPALQLVLLDAQDQIIASRIFTAQDYFSEHDRAPQFIEPQQEIEIRLDFDSSQLQALGYRLHLLYP